LDFESIVWMYNITRRRTFLRVITFYCVVAIGLQYA